jgi:hypothetical protein
MADKSYSSYNIHASPETLNLIADDLNKTDEYHAQYATYEHIPLKKHNDNEEEYEEGAIIYNGSDSDSDSDDEWEDQETEFDREERLNAVKIVDNEIRVIKRKDYRRNLSYISSYVSSYAIIEVLDKYLFKIDKYDTSAWKLEENKSLTGYEPTTFLISKNKDVDYDGVDYKLSDEKLKQKQFNLTIGKAGAGKSSSQYKAFDTDQRLQNALYLYPTKDLAQDFAEKYNIEHITYQKFIVNGFEENKQFHYISSFKNLVIDECTFINDYDMEKIKKRAKKFNFVVHFIGDMDEERIYQLKAISETIKNSKGDIIRKTESITMDFMKQTFPNLYLRKLTKVYRNGGELLQRLNKIRDENLNDEQIIELFKDRVIDKSEIDYETDLQNIILSPKNDDVANYNRILYRIADDDEFIIQKDPKTNQAKNEINNKRRLIKKKDYQYHNKLKDADDKRINKHLGYAITAHLSQGKTYTGKMYVCVKGLYTENLLYVMLSRATDINNIHIIL